MERAGQAITPPNNETPAILTGKIRKLKINIIIKYDWKGVVQISWTLTKGVDSAGAAR
jgi:hypothetical protein